jgi:hypothetical protein
MPPGSVSVVPSWRRVLVRATAGAPRRGRYRPFAPRTTDQDVGREPWEHRLQRSSRVAVMIPKMFCNCIETVSFFLESVLKIAPDVTRVQKYRCPHLIKRLGEHQITDYMHAKYEICMGLSKRVCDFQPDIVMNRTVSRQLTWSSVKMILMT